MNTPNDLDAFFMPFTASRQFKAAPRLLSRAQGMHYYTVEGRDILDGTAGLWCCNAGHGRNEIARAVGEQLAAMDYAPAFQMAHPKSFALANRLVALTDKKFSNIFFTNSGSESAETAIKIARAYFKARGETNRTIVIGRNRGYHGVNYGGISVGAIPNNQAAFGPLLPDTDHLCDTHDLSRNAFSLGQPVYGADYADDLQRLIDKHGASHIAAVIVEPVAGSTGVLVPPQGYLQRLRKICSRHDILLIFDEVITGFGRVGAPFATDYFDVTPDIMAVAKGLTNGAFPMGAVMVQDHIYQSFMHGPEHLIEFFHGYTYSAHPAACAAALATLDIYEHEDLFEKARARSSYWQSALHSLASCPHVIDVRNIGLMGAIELRPHPDGPIKRAFSAFLSAFEKGVLIRQTGDILALSPPLIIEEAQIDQIMSCLREVLHEID